MPHQDPEVCEALLEMRHLVEGTNSKIDDLLRAFPDGQAGIEEHRRYHEAKIEAAREEAAFWRKLRYDLTVKGVIGIVVVLAGLLVVGIQTKLMAWLGSFLFK